MTAPKRQLGLSIAAAIVVANMIGAGVFTSTGFQAAALGDPMTILLLWVVGGVIALCGAACYAELGAMMPRAGGEYVYLREAYHPAVGFMSGWVSMTAGFSAPIAVSAIAFASYLSPVIGLPPSAMKPLACALIVAVSAMHAFDTKLGGRVQTGFTIAKAVLIVGFIVAGLASGNGTFENLATKRDGLGQLGTSSGLSAFATSLFFVGFAYSGWNAAAYIAGEIKDPQRTLPRALLLGTGTVMVLYLLLNITFLYAVPPEVMAPLVEFPLAECQGAELTLIDGVQHCKKVVPVIEVGDLAAKQLFGSSAGQLVSTLIALALVSSVSAMLMAGPRVYAAMAADHALPRQLAYYTKRGVPAVAVVTQCVLAIVFVLIGNLGELIKFVGFTLSIFAALTVGAVFVMRRRGNPSPYRTIGYPVTPLLFIGLSAWAVYLQVTAAPDKSLIVLGLLVVGAIVWWLTSRGKSHLKIEEDEPDPVPAETTKQPSPDR